MWSFLLAIVITTDSFCSYLYSSLDKVFLPLSVFFFLSFFISFACNFLGLRPTDYFYISICSVKNFLKLWFVQLVVDKSSPLSL